MHLNSRVDKEEHMNTAMNCTPLPHSVNRACTFLHLLTHVQASIVACTHAAHLRHSRWACKYPHLTSPQDPLIRRCRGTGLPPCPLRRPLGVKFVPAPHLPSRVQVPQAPLTKPYRPPCGSENQPPPRSRPLISDRPRRHQFPTH